MPDLMLTDDTKQYQDLAREFAAKEIAAQKSRLDKSREFPLVVLQKAFEIGLLNGRLPEHLGGLGLSVFDACVIAEEIGKACAGIGCCFWANDLGVAAVMAAGSEEQHNRWLKPLVLQFAIAAACFDRPQLSYRQSASDYMVSGQAVVANACHGKFFCAPASFIEGNKSTAFIVPLSAEGLTVGERLPPLGLQAADIRYVTLSDVRIGGDQLLGTEGGGKSVFTSAAEISLPILSSYAAGISAAALEHAVRYAQERQTMGTAIANHQAVALMLADIARQLEASRFMIRKAAWLADHAEHDLPYAYMANSFATNAAMQAATDAVQVFGGYGYSKEYPVEKLMRDAKMMQLCKQPLACTLSIVAESILSGV